MTRKKAIPSDRSRFNFVAHARNAFSFLEDLGFLEVEAQPTLVRYRKDEVELDVYHGRQSYEIGAGISRRGRRYSISDICRTVDRKSANNYRNFVAATPDAVPEALQRLADVLKQYGTRALQGDIAFFVDLEYERKRWSKNYAEEVLAEQLLPQAEAAFRRADYKNAAQLFSRVREKLSPTQLKKLAIAERRINRD
jgi:hypothetical protein